MTNAQKYKNETVAEVLAEFGENIELMRKCKCVGVSLWNCLKFKLRIEAAWKREKEAVEARRPRRNCDRFATGEDAFSTFDAECKIKMSKADKCRARKSGCSLYDSIHCFAEWILSVNKEESK